MGREEGREDMGRGRRWGEGGDGEREEMGRGRRWGEGGREGGRRWGEGGRELTFSSLIL